MVLVEHLEIDGIGRRMVFATQFNAFPHTSLHLGEARPTLDHQIVLIGSQTQQTPSHFLACATRAGFTGYQDEADPAGIGSQFLSAQAAAAHLTAAARDDRARKPPERPSYGGLFRAGHPAAHMATKDRQR